MSEKRKRRKRVLVRALIAVVVAVGVYAVWNTTRILRSFGDIERVKTDLEAARSRLETALDSELPPPPPEDTDTTEPPPKTDTEPPDENPDPDLSHLVGQQLPYDPDFAAGPQFADELFDAFLIIGSDARENLGGSRADVIILALLPKEGSSPILVSLPRDLYLPNPCHRSPTRINAALNGCGDLANGPELLALMIDEYTGIEPDHFALFDFENFVRVIDAVGGVTVCVENPVRENMDLGFLELPEGCSVVNGTQALLWMRSRHTEEFVDGRWRTMPGVNDLARTERQQKLLIEMLVKLGSFRDLGSLVDVVGSLADAVTIDEGITLGQVVGLAWDMRGLNPLTIGRVRPPVVFHTTAGGASVLLPTQPFSEVLAEVYSP